jgi:hypothetical protein
VETLSPTLNTVYAPPGMLELLTETRNLTAFWLEPVTVFGSLHLTVLSTVHVPCAGTAPL